MAFADDLIVVGNESATYSLISMDGGNSIRRSMQLGLDKPQLLLIKHEVVKKGTLVSDRHLVRFEITRPQAETGLAVTGSGHCVFDAPRGTILSEDMEELAEKMRGFLGSTGFFLKLLNGEP